MVWFKVCLVQSVAGGNTMVFNNKMKQLFESTGLVAVVSHDWWGYQIATGSGGEVFYDPKPHILYRQHSESLIGGNASFLSKLERLSPVKPWVYTPLYEVRALRTEFGCWGWLSFIGKLEKVPSVFGWQRSSIKSNSPRFRIWFNISLKIKLSRAVYSSG